MSEKESLIIRDRYETSDLWQAYRNGGEFVHTATKLGGNLRAEDSEMFTDAAMSYPSSEEIRLHGSSDWSKSPEVYALNLSRVFVHAGSFCRTGTASIDNTRLPEDIERSGSLTVCYNFSSRQGYNPSENVPKFLGVTLSEIPRPIHDTPSEGISMPYRFQDTIGAFTYGGGLTAADAPLVAFRSFQAEHSHELRGRNDELSFSSMADRSYSGTNLTRSIGVEFSEIYEHDINGQRSSCRDGKAKIYEPLTREPVREGPVTICRVISGPEP